MLSVTRKYIEDLSRYDENDEVVKYLFKRLGLKHSVANMTPIYDVCRNLGIKVVTTDFKREGGDVAQFIERADKQPYICVDSSTNCRKVRFNIATMVYCALHSKGCDKFVITKTPESQNLHRAKTFAANLLMPTPVLKKVVYEKDQNGEYKYLVKYNGKDVLPFRAIHYIAERFGVEFSQCAKRIFYSNIASIRRISDRCELKRRLKGPDASEAMRRKLIPNSEKHDYVLRCYLINNLHFPKITKVNEQICEKLRRETVKNDTIIEGVLSSASQIERFLNKYKSGKVEEMYKLPISQRIVIGHYETIRNLENIPFNKRFFNELHARLFQYAVETDEEKEWLTDPAHCNRGENDNFIDFVPGQYRQTQNIINGASFMTDSVSDIYNTMSNIYYDTEYLLSRKDEMSNVDYINNVNYLVNRFCVCHPFEDGNGRVSRLFMNYLFIQKGLPPVYIDASKKKAEYIDALSELSDDCRKKLYEKIDYSRLNNIIMHGMLETESIFFPPQAMLSQPLEYINNQLNKPKSATSSDGMTKI